MSEAPSMRRVWDLFSIMGGYRADNLWADSAPVMSFADIADVGMHIDVQPLKGNKLNLVYFLQRYEYAI